MHVTLLDLVCSWILVVTRKSKNWIISVLLGVIGFLSFAPFGVYPLFFCSFGWLFKKIFLRDISRLDIFSYCLAFFASTLSWLSYPIGHFHNSWILSIAALLLGSSYLACHLLLALLAMQRWCCSTLPIAVITFPIALLIPIFFCGAIFPAFPWILPCYMFYADDYLLQSAYWLGSYGLSFVALLLSALLGAIFVTFKQYRNIASIYGAIFALILAIMFGAGYWRLQNHPLQLSDITVRLVQGNIPQEHKQDRSLAAENLRTYLYHSLHNDKLDMILWPEAALPYLYKDSFVDLHNKLSTVLMKDELLLTGAIRRCSRSLEDFNSVVFVDHHGKNVGVYDKSRLVPFGEFIPCRSLLSLAPIANAIGDFAVGSTPYIQKIGNLTIAFAICYEIIFPYDTKQLQKADLLLNFTNDGWFGNSLEPYQHYAIVRMKAVELGIPIVRVTNVGISAVFDAYGRVIAKIPFGTTGHCDVKIPQKMLDRKQSCF